MVKLENDYANPDNFARSRKAEATRKLYAVALRSFARHVGLEYSDLPQYLKKAKLEDLATFGTDLSAGTRKGYVSIVKAWLEYNDIEFSKRERDDLRITVKQDDRTAQRPLTPDIIRKLCDVSGLQGRSLFITLLSTGCRIEELLFTELQDIDLDRGVMRIPWDITKTKNSRCVVLSLEAVDILKTWIHDRDTYLKASANRGQFDRKPVFVGEGKKRRELKRENLLFPYSYETARSLFATAIGKVFNTDGRLRKEWGDLYDQNTGRGKLHLHSFRGTFRMELSKGARPEIVEKLMGHEGYLQGAYKEINIDELIAEYRKAEEHVTVYATDTLRQKLKIATSTSAKHEAAIEKMQQQIAQLVRAAEIAEKMKN
ncbi:tyrosine-type recombinase/integrase [Methanoregula sp.]|jgi:integrase|uniref:tyrosine-type recombinase/integrase n=1 Tax=Methanoregula sp. TaxID=2052170 RepID=UPI003C198EDE